MSNRWPEWLRDLARAHQRDNSDESRMMFSDGVNRWRADELAAGRCACGEPLANSTNCTGCAAKQNFRVERRRSKLIEQGTCGTCGQRPARPSRKTCQECAEVDSQHSKAAVEAKKQAGLCIVCKAPAKKGRARCKSCLKDETDGQMARFEERRSKGTCASCPASTTNNWYCDACLAKRRTMAKERRKRSAEADVIAAMKTVLEYEAEWFETGTVFKDERYLAAREIVMKRAV